MLQWMTACHRDQEEEKRLYGHVCVVSEHADCDITVNKSTHCKIYAHDLFCTYNYIYIIHNS